jgi:hypothetical protein
VGKASGNDEQGLLAGARRRRGDDAERVRTHAARRRQQGATEDPRAGGAAQGAPHGGAAGDGRAAVWVRAARRAADPLRRPPLPAAHGSGVHGQQVDGRCMGGCDSLSQIIRIQLSVNTVILFNILFILVNFLIYSMLVGYNFFTFPCHHLQ